jgi:hypothetical protein
MFLGFVERHQLSFEPIIEALVPEPKHFVQVVFEPYIGIVGGHRFAFP